VEKSSPRIFATSAIFKKLPKGKNRPIGENSANLVTLLIYRICGENRKCEDEENLKNVRHLFL
jgi:hypothetical protein